MKALAGSACAALALGTMPVAGQEMRFDPTPLETCLASLEDPAASPDCIGRAAYGCMEQPMGETTPGMAFCLEGEFDQWDVKLNEAYQALRSGYLEQDENRLQGAPALADALRDMQRGWISFRDARCGFETAQWHGGTGSSPAFLGCMMQMTAEQTIYLWSVFHAGR